MSSKLKSLFSASSISPRPSFSPYSGSFKTLAIRQRMKNNICMRNFSLYSQPQASLSPNQVSASSPSSAPPANGAVESEAYFKDLKSRLSRSWAAGLEGMVPKCENHVTRTEVMEVLTSAINHFKKQQNIIHINFDQAELKDGCEPCEDDEGNYSTEESSKPTELKICEDESVENAEKLLKERKDCKEGITIVGDTHGQLYDVFNLLRLNGDPGPNNKYLFNGDLVDRGSFSLQTILLVLAYVVKMPDHVFVLRGNHETVDMNVNYGFFHEVLAKYDVEVMKTFWELFEWLPLAAVVNKSTFVVHGGLVSQQDVTLEHINAIQRWNTQAKNPLLHDLLWSDPMKKTGRAFNHSRQGGLLFGPDVTERFLLRNKLKLLVRSHQVRKNGFSIEHEGRLVTLFSAPNYCDSMSNKGAYMRWDKDKTTGVVDGPVLHTFDAVAHPNIPPMAHMNLFRRQSKL